MKRTFLTRRNALLSAEGVSWGAYALVVVLVLLGTRLLVPNLFFYITAPLLKSGGAVADYSHRFFSQFGERSELVRNFEKLQEENTALAHENETLIQKTTSLEAMLGSGASAGRVLPTSVVAGVLSRPPETPYDTLVIDKGTRQGAALGQEAFGSEQVPVGIVTGVMNDFSRVTLFSAPGMSVGARLGAHELPFTLTGAGGGVLTGAITRSTLYAVGDTVFVDGPGAQPVGEVVRIDDDPAAPSVTLQIKPVTNPFSISWVVLRESGVVFKTTSATSTVP